MFKIEIYAEDPGSEAAADPALSTFLDKLSSLKAFLNFFEASVIVFASMNVRASDNPLLAMVVRFLNTGIGKSEDLQERLASATIDELVPTFAFLHSWFGAKDHKTPEFFAKEQVVFTLISQIVSLVPPVTLLFRISDLNWRMNQRSGALYSVYDSIFHRLRKVRTYFERYFTENHILGPPPLFDGERKFEWKIWGQLMELETDVSYQNIYKRQFIKLIFNRAPLVDFQPLLQHQNSKMILTSAIQKILNKLNSKRDATHAELLCSFSILFLYIHAFTTSQAISSQMICESLLTRPFFSPFCLLALINHIPQTLDYFGLLIPKELATQTQSHDVALRTVQRQFLMVDLSSGSELNKLIRKIPELLTSYFLSSPLPNGNFGVEKDTASIIFDFHVKGTSTYDRMKGLIEIAKNSMVEPLVVCGSSSQLLNCVIFSFQKAFADCYDHKMFTPEMCSFLKSVISFVVPTHGPKVVPKFLDPMLICDDARQRRTAELLLRAIIRNCGHLLPLSSAQKYLVPFCLKAVKAGGDLTMTSRIILMKILHSVSPQFPDCVIEALSECVDLVVLLDYMEATFNYTRVSAYDEYDKLKSVRDNVIMKQLLTTPLLFEQTQQGLIIRCSQAASLDGTSFIESDVWRKVVLILKENMYADDFAGDFSYHSILALRIAAQCERMENRHFAELVTRKISALLTEAKDKSHCMGNECECFPIYLSDVVFPILQYALSRLTSLEYSDLALHLLKLCEPLLASEPLALSWLVRFTCKYYTKLTLEMKSLLTGRLLSKLPGYDLYCRETVADMIELLRANEVVYCRSPDILSSEYSSTYVHIMDFAVCSLLASHKSHTQILAELLQPVIDVTHIKPKREKVLGIVSELAAELPPLIGIGFFEGLMQYPSLQAAVDAARIFLVHARIDVVLAICERATPLIRKDEKTLSAYIDAVVPNFPRLRGNKAVATKLLCGMIESLNVNSPRHQQNKVIDVVALIYLTLKLHSSRGAIIAAGNGSGAMNGLPPEMKTVLATTLDVE